MLDDKQRAMLDEFGVFVLPEEISHDVYATMVEVVRRRENQEITLFCRGNGGDSRSALAIVDLLRWHGFVTGVLISEANSSHGVIWAGCYKRFITENGLLGIHEVSVYPPHTMDGNHARLMTAELERVNQQFARVYASASNQDFDWWLERLNQTRSGGLRFFDRHELKMLHMGEFYVRSEIEKAIPHA